MVPSTKDYERAATSSDIKTYKWLSVEVQRTVNMAKMHRNYQERDDRMRELVAGKSNKVAATKEDDKDKGIRRDRSEKKNKDPPEPQPSAASK